MQNQTFLDGEPNKIFLWHKFGPQTGVSKHLLLRMCFSFWFFTDWVIWDCILDITNAKLWIISFLLFFFLDKCSFFCFNKQLPWVNLNSVSCTVHHCQFRPFIFIWDTLKLSERIWGFTIWLFPSRIFPLSSVVSFPDLILSIP